MTNENNNSKKKPVSNEEIEEFLDFFEREFAKLSEKDKKEEKKEDKN